MFKQVDFEKCGLVPEMEYKCADYQPLRSGICVDGAYVPYPVSYRRNFELCVLLDEEGPQFNNDFDDSVRI